MSYKHHPARDLVGTVSPVRARTLGLSRFRICNLLIVSNLRSEFQVEAARAAVGAIDLVGSEPFMRVAPEPAAVCRVR
jgi:hypothetical protein